MLNSDKTIAKCKLNVECGQMWQNSSVMMQVNPSCTSYTQKTALVIATAEREQEAEVEQWHTGYGLCLMGGADS